MDLEKIDTIHTRKEIEGQPELWANTISLLKKNKGIQKFLKPLIENKELNILLTGAGTSAFIGETVEGFFRSKLGLKTRAVSTTTLVTHFESFVDRETPLLLISFARSGNSPESNAVVNIAEDFCENVHHLAITCNSKGLLAKNMKELSNALTIVLPPKSEDKGLAMTGSFTSMVLAALYIANSLDSNTTQDSIIEDIFASASETISECKQGLKELSFKAFDRIVFLGAGPLKGIAKESHLKVQELTDGSVVGKFDSFLGFRHGPKAVVNKRTVIVFLFSSDEKVFRYEKDLVKEIQNDNVAMHCIGVFCDKNQANELDLDQKIVFNLKKESNETPFNSLLYVIPAQLLGLYKSLDLGLDPDSPSENNVISRVVRGVTIYN